MYKKNEYIIDLILPTSIYRNKDIFNSINNYVTSSDEETREYHKANILSSLSDINLLQVYVLLDILEKNNNTLLNYINEIYFDISNLVKFNIGIEIGNTDYYKSILTDFDFNKYIEDISEQTKYEIINEDNKTILLIDDDYIKYISYVKYHKLNKNIFINISKNLNIYVYNNGIKYIQDTEFKNSDVPNNNVNNFYYLNKFYKQITKGKL